MSACSIIAWEHGCAADAVPHVGESRNVEFVNGTSDSSPTLREGHCGIFQVYVHQCRWDLLADGMPAYETPR